MAILETECPHCHEDIQVDISRPELFCMYCGKKLVASELKGFEKQEHTKGVLIKGPGKKVSTRVPVYIDGTKVCSLFGYETAIVDVVPGKHTVMAKVGIEGSKKMVYDLKDGDTLEIDYRGLRGYIVNKIE